MADKTLYLVDGNSILYRSFYAIHRLSNAEGFPTNAIYGFVVTLRKILDGAKPDLLGIVFDTAGPTFRHELYEEYKAQRKPMPDDLVRQVPRLKEVLSAFRIPLFENSRYEADDVLASLAAKAASRGLHTVIVTTDKDLFQVVDATTSVYNPAKDVLIDEAKVKELFGVSPSQVVDVLTLWGDPTDNIPGVPGIGEKIAKQLIAEFGSLEALLAGLDKVKNVRVRTAIRENGDKLAMSRKLALIESGLDVDLDPEALKIEEPDRDALARLFKEFGFGSLLAEYAKPAPPSAKDYTTILEEQELRDWADRIRRAGAVSVDTETDHVSPTRARLVGFSLAVEPGQACYVPLRHDAIGAPAQIPIGRALDIVRGVLEDPAVRKIGQNIKYDLLVFEHEGVRLRGLDLDTMVLSYLLEPNWGKHNLDRLSLAYLGEASIPFQDVVGKGKAAITMNGVPVERATPYACQDADFALALSRTLWPKVEAAGLDRVYRELEQPLVGILAEMEAAGVRIDTAALRDLAAGMQADLQRLEAEIHAQAGLVFNINSPRQLADVLFHKLQLPVSRKTKGTGSLSTAIDVLEEMADKHPIVRRIVEFRQTSKLKSTYADALPALVDPATGRVHTSYNQTVAATGRLSSSDPNLQNIPARGEMGARFRRAFIPADGCLFLAADYSQIELRVLAHMSGDPGLIETFRRGADVHQETADRVFGAQAGLFRNEARRRAKIINFSVIYGTSAFSLAKQIETSAAEAQKFIDAYEATYPKVKAFLDGEVENARTTGSAVTLFGRKRQVPELRAADRPSREAGRRIALNTPIQGTAADLMKKAMIDIRREIGHRGLRSRMILQVHDELVFEVPPAERAAMDGLVREAMEGVMRGVCAFLVPLQVTLGWGDNWADCK
ncbi:MAG: DNA polymerase I [Acidobacteriota bacterium]|nr:DNA polymerase I [Acidobacteriota bacterium]